MGPFKNNPCLEFRKMGHAPHMPHLDNECTCLKNCAPSGARQGCPLSVAVGKNLHT